MPEPVNHVDPAPERTQGSHASDECHGLVDRLPRFGIRAPGEVPEGAIQSEQPNKVRRCDDEPAARLRHAHELGESCGWRRHVLERLKTADEVEGRVRKGKTLDIAGEESALGCP